MPSKRAVAFALFVVLILTFIGCGNDDRNATKLASINVTTTTTSVALGRTAQFTAAAVNNDGSVGQLSAPIWTATPDSVASVDSNGLVTTKSQGTATITVSSQGVTGTATLTVTAPVLASVAVSPNNASKPAGRQQQFIVTGKLTDNTDAPSSALQNCAWTSSDNALATITASGLATAKAVGHPNITATCNAINSSVSFAVTAAVLDHISVSPTDSSLALGGTTQFAAVGVMSDNSTQTLASVQWTSSNTAAATIDSASGLATSHAIGDTTITAASQDLTASTGLAIVSPAVVSIAVTPANPSIDADDDQQFTATATLSDSTTSDVTNTATWESSSTTAATMDSGTPGLAHGVAAGRTTITATITIAALSVSGSTELTVTSSTATGPRGLVYACASNQSPMYGFAIQSDGTLAAVPGSPGTNNGTHGNWFLAASASGDYLYTQNITSVYASSIDRDTGAWTAVPGSPFTVPGIDTQGQIAHPTKPWMYVATYGSGSYSIRAYDISTGALSLLGPDTTLASFPEAMAITPDGQYLYIVSQDSSSVPYTHLLVGYSIDQATGALTSIGSFSTNVAGAFLLIDAAGRNLYVSSHDTFSWEDVAHEVMRFNIAGDGSLALASTTTIAAGGPITGALDTVNNWLVMGVRAGDPDREALAVTIRLDPETGELGSQTSLRMDASFNANKMAIGVAPEGGFVYLDMDRPSPEWIHVITVYELNTTSGALTEKQRVNLTGFQNNPMMLVVPPKATPQ